MERKFLTSRYSSLKIKLSTIMAVVLLFILILPSGVFSIGTIYESDTPYNISYNWLHYEFGIILLFIMMAGIWEVLRRPQYVFFLIFIIELLREILFYFIYDNSIFTASAYEMYLTVFLGYSLFLLAKRCMDRFEHLDWFYGIFLVSNMLTLYINVALGGAGTTYAGLGEAGRYHASNLDVGGTGILCVLCMIYVFFSHWKRKYKYSYILLSFIGLILSGSRSNFLYGILILGIYIIDKIFIIFYKGKININKKKFYNYIFCIIICVILISLVVMNWSQIADHLDITRLEAAFSIAGISADDSFLGRSESIRDGLDIIKTYPLGISGYFVNLQEEMTVRGFPTFPHNTLISGYILFGPVTLGLYILWINFLYKYKNLKNKYFWIILYYFISTITSGGPMTNFKTIFTICMATYLAWNSIKITKKQHLSQIVVASDTRKNEI